MRGHCPRSASSVMVLRCIVHFGDSKSAEAIKQVDGTKWQKHLAVVKTRKALVRKTKYDEIIADFPEHLDESHGYHTRCYKNFTAVPKVEAEPGESSATVIMRNEIK